MSEKIIKQCGLQFEMQPDDDNYHVIKGYATTYGNTDLVGDVIAKGAFSESFKNQDNREPVILWQLSRS